MCQYILDNCGCGGIISLELGRIKFPILDTSSNKNNVNNSGKCVIKKFAQKFENLKYFSYFDASNIHGKINYGLEFCKLLQHNFKK